eukprot:gene8000-12302_t
MRNPKKGTETTKAQTGRKRTRQGDAKTIVRPTQPIPLEAWKHAADGPGVAYAYNWDGVMKTVERLAVTESKDYTYVHLAEGDGKLDHWVESEKLSNDRLTSDTPTRSTSSSSRSRQVRRVDHIVFGDMIIPAWYSSPYPAALNADLMANGGRLFVCDVCLKYTTSAAQMTRHRGELGNCLGNGPLRGIHHPPGSQIYAHNGWSLWDVDGGAAQEPHLEEEFMMWEHSSIVGHAPPAGSLAILEHAGRLRFCNNLCLLTRLFLDTKLNRYGTNPFRFFVLTEEKNGRHMVRGMFSREKGHHKNNLSSSLAITAGSLAFRRVRFNNMCLLTRLFLDTKLNRYGANPFRFFVLIEEKNGRHMVRGVFSREKGHHKNNL